MWRAGKRSIIDLFNECRDWSATTAFERVVIKELERLTGAPEPDPGHIEVDHLWKQLTAILINADCLLEGNSKLRNTITNFASRDPQDLRSAGLISPRFIQNTS
ncbi:hypothetical protein V6x_15570 [Gimesia chilikensis]|uniref:Uncharacterized protein n=1 Tax=Gimesia chilikensis TaxID=2605989 RepID=A0A517W9E3_9PLAN|nr:hypothetical protein V6x_15570 [Gimesia chilikensis]